MQAQLNSIISEKESLKKAHIYQETNAALENQGGVDDSISSKKKINTRLLEETNQKRKEYQMLQAESRKLDSRIHSNHTSIANLSKELKSIYIQTKDIRSTMKSASWKEYSEKDIDKLEEEYKEILEKKSMIKVEHEEERRKYDSLMNKLKEDNKKLESVIQDKEKTIRFNILSLRKIRKQLDTNYNY